MDETPSLRDFDSCSWRSWIRLPQRTVSSEKEDTHALKMLSDSDVFFCRLMLNILTRTHFLIYKILIMTVTVTFPG